MGEVEAQPVGRHQRSGLLHVRAEDRAQGVVQQVGGGVVAAHGVAPVGVDGRHRRLPRRDAAGGDPRHVTAQSRQGERGVDHVGRAGLGGDDARVTHLATALGVERRLVEEDLHQVVVAGHVEHGEHPRRRRVGDVALEHRGAVLLDDVAVGVDVGRLAHRRSRRLGPRPLLAHRRLEAGDVDRDRALRGDLLGELEREAVGVVEQERGLTRQRGRLVDQLALEDGEAVAQRLAEVLFLLGRARR